MTQRATNEPDDIASRLAARDRFRKKLSSLKTPEQRMAEMSRLQQAMWETLRRSPEGYSHFMKRNFRARRVSGPITDVR